MPNHPSDTDPLMDGFRIGLQLGAQTSPQTASGESQTNIVINNQRNSSIPFFRGLLGLTAFATLAFAIADEWTKTESETEGSSSVVDVRAQHSVAVWNGEKIVSGSAENDVTGPANPWSYFIGVVERQVEYLPEGTFEISAVDDPELGFYLLFVEKKDGEILEPDFSRIQVMTPKPEPCPIKVVDNEIRPKEYCTPITDESSRGILSGNGWQGMPIFNDTGIMRIGREALDVAIDNSYCELALVFGAPVSETMSGNSSNITQQSIYDGVEEAVKANFRRDLSRQYGLPLTNEIGMPIILWQDDVKVLREIVESAGKPLTEFTAGEYSQHVQLWNALNPNTTHGIDPGPTFATEILELHEKKDSVKKPSQTPELNNENAATSGWNWNCLPDPGTEEAEQMVENEQIRIRAGRLNGSPAFAQPAADGKSYTEQDAKEMILAFRERTGV